MSILSVHAGSITQKALEGIGGGGGHFSMAGGVLTKEGMKQLGDDPDFMIRKRFLDAIHEEAIVGKKH